jgi:ubiquinol-cytochrome c reductase cytochrome b subunit
VRGQLTGYYAPKNFNVWYFFGSLALLVLVIQLVTGIFLTMHYKVGAATAFDVGRVHHARSALRLAAALPALAPARRRSSSSSTCTCSARCCTARTRQPRELLWLFGMRHLSWR